MNNKFIKLKNKGTFMVTKASLFLAGILIFGTAFGCADPKNEPTTKAIEIDDASVDNASETSENIIVEVTIEERLEKLEKQVQEILASKNCILDARLKKVLATSWAMTKCTLIAALIAAWLSKDIAHLLRTVPHIDKISTAVLIGMIAEIIYPCCGN